MRPFPFLDADLLDPAHSAALSDEMTEIGLKRPDVAAYLARTEHDGQEQWRFEPLKKRHHMHGDPSFETLYRKTTPAGSTSVVKDPA